MQSINHISKTNVHGTIVSSLNHCSYYSNEVDNYGSPYGYSQSVATPQTIGYDISADFVDSTTAYEPRNNTIIDADFIGLHSTYPSTYSIPPTPHTRKRTFFLSRYIFCRFDFSDHFCLFVCSFVHSRLFASFSLFRSIHINAHLFTYSALYPSFIQSFIHFSKS